MTGPLRLGELEVDLSARRLTRDGVPVHVEPRVFDLLELLLDWRGAVVGRDAIVARVWGGRAVSDDAIGAALRDLRRALGETGRAPRLLHTVYGRGYRLDAPDRWTDPPAVAILAPEADTELHAAAQAVRVDLTAAVARGRGLTVIDHRSAEAALAQGGGTGPLAARWAVTGRLTAIGSRVRLGLVLSDREAGRDIWGEAETVDLAALLDALPEMAGRLAARIETEIGARIAQVARARPIAELDAWSAYHRAMRALATFRPDRAEEIGGLLGHAARLDPSAARIRAGQSALAWQRAFLATGADRAAAGREAIALAEAALNLDDRDPQAHCALGRARLIADDAPAARAALGRAIALDPSHATAHYALAWTRTHDGRPAPEALPLIRRARRLSPLDPLAYAFDLLEADLHYFAGAPDAALPLARRAAAHPGIHHQALAIAAWLMHASGAETEAMRTADRVRAMRPGYGYGDYRAVVPVRGRKRQETERHFRALGF